MRTFIALIILVLFTSCGSRQRTITNSVNRIDSTSVEKHVRTRDTIVSLPFYKVDVAVPISQLTEKPVTLTNERAKVEIYKKDDVVYATASCDSLVLELELRDSIINTLREVRTDTKVTLPPEQIKFVPWPVKVLAWFGGILLLILAGLIVIKIYNPFSR